MTEKQRENLERIAGMLEGITWGIDNERICDGIYLIIESIDKVLAEDGKDD